jgi:hypothetical protein
MSFFNSILSKLGMGKDDAAPEVAATPVEAPAVDIPAVETPVAPVVEAAPEAPAVTAVPVVDVMAQLDALSAKSGNTLNWKTSIVDLLKLLGLDSSYSARKELAAELECPADKMAASAQMNMWLHKTVLQKIAANGGNLPADLID